MAGDALRALAGKRAAADVAKRVILCENVAAARTVFQEASSKLSVVWPEMRFARRRAIPNSQEEDSLKNLLKLLALALLAALVLLASSQPPASRAATATGVTKAAPVTCGASVHGHVLGSDSHDYCPDDGKIIFKPTDHYTFQGTDICPICGAATTNGHTQSGG